MTEKSEEKSDQSNKGEEAENNEKKIEANNMPPNESKLPDDTNKDVGDEVPLNQGSVKVEIKPNNDANVELGGEKAKRIDYPALTKQELMKYAEDPFWVKLRWSLFILFWVAWVGMLVAAVAIIVMAPKCPRPEPKQWWQKEPVYEVVVRSFKDSNGDGQGDLKGVESKVDYLVSLGIGSVWLTPIYPSPQRDNGYDIADYMDIDPTYGTLQDFKDLAKVLHENDIKLIMDFVPNHSSNEHPWFKKSENREEGFEDYYVWAGTRGQKPSNWQSVFGGSAWEWSETRQQWYLHQFYKEQPDLNMRNPKVVEEFEKILKFWMDLGVDGFRMDAVAHLFEDENLADEALVPGKSGYEGVDHSKTYNLPEVLELLKRFRQVLDEKTKEDVYNPRIMMTEAYLPLDDLMEYYGKNFTAHAGDISHLPLNLAFVDAFKTEADATAQNVDEVVSEYLEKLPKKSFASWPNFHLGNHDKSRIASRVGHALVDAFHMITMLMPGTPITYYGEEIGMKDNLEITNPKDFRDPFRTPMQWDSTAHAGFTSGSSPWLPVSPDYMDINVKAQAEARHSHLKVYKSLTQIREQQAILFGEFNSMVNGTVYAFNRVKKGNPGFLCAINFGSENVVAKVNKLPYLPASGNVHARTFHAMKEDLLEDGKDTDPEAMWKSVNFEGFPLRPMEGIVVTFVPEDNLGIVEIVVPVDEEL